MGYDAFYWPESPGVDEAFERGLLWLQDWGAPTKSVGLVWTPTKGQLTDGSTVVGRLLGKQHAKTLGSGGSIDLGHNSIRAAWGRRLPAGWSGGPILAMWPDPEELWRLHDTRGLRALLAVPWAEGSLTEWIEAVHATNIQAAVGHAAVVGRSGSHQLDPVVAAALDSIVARINTTTGLAHPSDKQATVEAFELLRGAGYLWDGAACAAHIIRRGVSADTARQIREVADGILEGKRFRTRGVTSVWRVDIVELWEVDAKKPTR